MIDRIAAVRAFLLLAETLSFSRTAELLGVSVTTVSRLIGSLEEETGQRLLHRTTRSVTLTTEGEVLLPALRAWLAESDRLFGCSSDAKRLRVAASVPFFDMALSGLIADFVLEHPDLEVDFVTTAEPLDLVRNAIDVGFQEGSDPQPGYVAKKLGVIECRFCATPDYLARAGTPERLSDLSQHRLLSLVNARDVWQFIDERGRVRDIPVKPVFRANYAAILEQAVRKDAGIAPLPSAVADPAIARGELVEVLPRYRGTPHTMVALVATRRNLTPVVRRLLDFMEKRLARQA